MIRAATMDDVAIIADRIAEESERFTNETGAGFGRIQLGIGAIEAALNAGDRIFIGQPDGAEGERIAIWIHREPGIPGIWLNHVWGPSARHRGILRYAAQKAVDLGFGAVMGHFPNIDTPIVNAAKTIVLPATGDYVGTTWTPRANGRVCRVRISTALTRLVNAGAPVEA